MARLIYSRTSQSGAILVIAMVFVGVITLLSMSSMRGSTTGIHLAQNEEARFAVSQYAHAVTEAIISDPATTPPIGRAGSRI